MPKTAHQRRRHVRSLHNRKNKLVNYLYAALTFIFLTVIVYFFVGGRVWDGETKLILGLNSNNSQKILILDPVASEAIRLTIPGDTEVNLSQNFGTLRLKNVWSFGENEGNPGDIFTKTLAKNFFIPIYLFSKEDPENFSKFIFKNKFTNIGFLDRVKIYFFLKKLKNVSVIDIDLEKSLFVKKERLSDGEYGFRIYENLFKRLYMYFNDPHFSDNQVKIYISDASGKYSVADGVGKTLEVIGGKVVTIDRISVEDLDCEVWGKNKDIVKKVADLYSCKILKKDTDMDVTIKLGSQFAKRY